jgi:hypothetical protein
LVAGSAWPLVPRVIMPIAGDPVVFRGQAYQGSSR